MSTQHKKNAINAIKRYFFVGVLFFFVFLLKNNVFAGVCSNYFDNTDYNKIVALHNPLYNVEHYYRTIMWWGKDTTATTYQDIMWWFGGTTPDVDFGHSFYFIKTCPSYCTYLFCPSWGSIFCWGTNYIINDQNWHFFVLRINKNENTWQFFVDGQKVADYSLNSYWPTQNKDYFSIGDWSVGHNSPSNFNVDDFAVITDFVSDSQIQEYYNDGNGRCYTVTDDVRLYYQFSECSGTSYEDSSRYQNNGYNESPDWQIGKLECVPSPPPLPPTPPELPATTSTIFFSYQNYTNKWATPTPIFAEVIDTIGYIMNPILVWANNFQNFFSRETAENYAMQLAGSIRNILSYTAVFNNFFADLPIAEGLIILLVCCLIKIFLSIILKIINFLKPF